MPEGTSSPAGSPTSCPPPMPMARRWCDHSSGAANGGLPPAQAKMSRAYAARSKDGRIGGFHPGPCDLATAVHPACRAAAHRAARDPLRHLVPVQLNGAGGAGATTYPVGADVSGRSGEVDQADDREPAEPGDDGDGAGAPG